MPVCSTAPEETSVALEDEISPEAVPLPQSGASVDALDINMSSSMTGNMDDGGRSATQLAFWDSSDIWCPPGKVEGVVESTTVRRGPTRKPN